MSKAETIIRKSRTLIAKKQYGASELLLVQFLAEYPNNRRAHEVLADIAKHKHKGDPVYAPVIQAFERALGHYNKAEFSTSIAIANTLLEQFPADADILNLKGLSELLSGQIAAGIETFRKAAHYHSQHPVLHMHLGNALLEAGMREQAMPVLKKAIEIKPSFAEAHYNLGKCLEQTGLIKEAISTYENAVKIKPDYADAWNNLGNCLKNGGDFIKAVDAYQRALAIRPDFSEPMRNLADSHKFEKGDPLIGRIETLLAKPDLPLIDKARLHYALAKAASDTGDDEEFIDGLGRANQLHRDYQKFDIAEDMLIFERVRARFSSDDEDVDTGDFDLDAKRPVFILGMPRSGTTLIEQIISLHSAVEGLGELDFLRRIIYPDIMSQNPHQLPFSSVRARYFELVASVTSGRWFTDKMPLNGLWAGHIIRALPEAKIIYMNRDPMAVCWSNYRTWFPDRGMGFSNSLEDIGRFYREYETLLDFFEARFPGRIYRCDYEKLTESPKAEAVKIFDYLGLDFEEHVLRIEENKRAVRTASDHQIRNKIYTGSSEEWKRYEAWLSPLKQSLEIK